MNFSNFYIDDNGFTKNLLEEFVLLEAKKDIDDFNTYLTKKLTLIPSNKILELVTDSPEKFETDTKFEPISDSLDVPKEVSDKVTTLFLLKQVVRDNKGTYEITGGKLVPTGKTKGLSRETVLRQAEKNKIPLVSLIVKSLKTGNEYELIGSDNIITQGFSTELARKIQQKEALKKEKKLTVTTQTSSKEFVDQVMNNQFIPDTEWKLAGRVEAVQGVGAVDDFQPIIETLVDILIGRDDEFDDVEYTEIYKNSKFRKIVTPIINAFDTPNASENIAYFRNNHEKFQIMDWIQICSLMLGTSLFSKNISKFSKTHIIHDNKSMTEYRKLTSTKDGESKTSTVDMVISNVPSEVLLQKLKTETPIVGEDGSIKVGSSVFYQISLKATTDAQLGAVKKFIMANYKAMNKEDAAKELVKESLNESILKTLSDKLKIGAEKIKSLGSKIFKSVTTFVANSIAWFKNIIKNIESLANKNKTKYANELFSGLLTEAEQSYSEIVEKFEQLNDKEKIDVCNKAIKKINAVLKDVESKLGKISNCGANVNYISDIIDIAPNTFNSLVGNYAISKTLLSMVTELNEPKKMMKGIADLLAEAILGSSKFPIWIVYSADEDLFVESPKLIKEKSEYTREKIASFEKNLNETTILFFFTARENSASMNKKNVGSYILNFYTLSDISGEDLNFSLMEYRCDSGNDIVIKATREISMDKFYENIINT